MTEERLTQEQKACPHRTVTQSLEAGAPKQTWTCDACGTQLVTLQTLLDVVKGLGKIWLEAD
jgi:hypothetical protein